MADRPHQVFQGRTRSSRIIHCGDGYHYNIRDERGQLYRLKCRHYKSGGRGCTATATVSKASGMLKHIGHHNHGPDPHLREDFEIRDAMIHEARTNVVGKRVRGIIDEARLSVRDPQLAMRFTRSRMCSAFYKARNENYRSIPVTLLYLGVLLGSPALSAICKTFDGVDYIFKGVVGCVQQKTVALVFASGRMLQFLQGCGSIHVDGTFRKRPRKPKVNQIFNIVVKHGGHVIGVVRVLMRSRTVAAYNEVWNFLKLIAPNFRPYAVHCDFEKAQIIAVKMAFPLCRVVGCLWHYGVCVSRMARKLGLTPLAQNNHLVFSFISCLCAVPLLPGYLIWHGVLEIWVEVQVAGWDEQLLPLFVYFEKEWKPRNAELTVYGDPERTNNCSESDNRMLANVVPQNFPNIWILLGGFVQLEYLAWSDKLAVDDLRQVNPARKATAVANDRKVQRAQQLLRNNDCTPGQLLKLVSYANNAAVLHGMNMVDSSDSEDSDSD